jgi:hypothetical protein
MQIALSLTDDSLVARASELYQRERGKAAGSMELARRLDPARLTRIATICHWGRSGSMLLASLLDDHPLVLALPQSLSTYIYDFCEDYRHLDLWQKLLVYPFYSAVKAGEEGDFFLANSASGDFAIEPGAYVAAVEALAAVHSANPGAAPGSRRAFVQFLHGAYAIALGKCPDATRAIMITAQHYQNDELAARLVSDFPGAKFIHTVRDPISTVDSWFDRRVEMAAYASARDNALNLTRYDCAVATMMDLLMWDAGHRQYANETRIVRFEDMHVATERTMRRLSRWLDIPYDECLVQSTWNGRPWVVMVRGVATAGTNPASARRRQKNLTALDRLLVRALMQENFIAWGYESRGVTLRGVVLALMNLRLLVLPLKIELVNVAVVYRAQLVPGMRAQGIPFALRGALFLLQRRVRMVTLVAADSLRRLTGRHRVMRPLTDETGA